MILKHDGATDIFDTSFAMQCPHCGFHSNITALSIPKYDLAMRFRPPKLGIAYFCNRCKEPVFLKFPASYDFGQMRILLFEQNREQIERIGETFDFHYLPPDVAADFQEALTSYSNFCYQAFAAMCRRTTQSALEALGAPGKDRVTNQLNAARELLNLDDDTYDAFQQIIIAGHDGAHPYLPRLSPERAAVLLELMKDVLDQLFVRRAKAQEAIELRNQDIASRSKPKTD